MSNDCTLFPPPYSAPFIPQSKAIRILGIDLGTSGIRGVIVERSYDGQDRILHSASVPLKTGQSQNSNNRSNKNIQSPTVWLKLLETLLLKLATSFNLSHITHLIVDATSSTVLLCSPDGTPLTDTLMYYDQQAQEQADNIQKIIESSTEFNAQNSAAQGPSSTLAKVLLLKRTVTQKNSPPLVPIICHQIDVINHYLCGCLNITDENNALKLGYDSVRQVWPEWVQNSVAPLSLPKVVTPGTQLGKIRSRLCLRYGFSASLTIHAGTTDSIAGFLASGASNVGDAVISLGSTLAVKVISRQPVFHHQYGIYSHKLNQNWLVGGASNSGGAVLLQAYSLSEMATLISAFPFETLSEKELIITNSVYPLISTGERFPIADNCFSPLMPIKPKISFNTALQAFSQSNKTHLKAHFDYFLALVKGLVFIEHLAYQKLHEISGESVKCLYSVGGGVKNTIWQHCRTHHFASDIILKKAVSMDAAYGVTKLIPLPNHSNVSHSNVSNSSNKME